MLSCAALLAVVTTGLGGCLTGDAPVERGWGHALAMVPGEDGAWGVYADESGDADQATIALVEWLGEDPSGRVVQALPDGFGGRVVQIDTPEGVWSAGVGADGELLWSDPIPEDPWTFAAAVADAGLTLEEPLEACDTCTAGIAPLVIAAVVVVVGVAAVALWTAFRDPGPTIPGSTVRDDQPTRDRIAACGQRPEGDVKRDATARRRYFEWVQCMSRATH